MALVAVTVAAVLVHTRRRVGCGTRHHGRPTATPARPNARPRSLEGRIAVRGLRVAIASMVLSAFGIVLSAGQVWVGVLALNVRAESTSVIVPPPPAPPRGPAPMTGQCLPWRADDRGRMQPGVPALCQDLSRLVPHPFPDDLSAGRRNI